jgi:hypothetical protein
MEKVMYQPVLSKEEWETGKLPSFGVYHSLKKAKEDYPKHTIAAYLEGEIEEPTYMDDNIEQRKEEAIEHATHYLCDSDELSMEEQIRAIAAHAERLPSDNIDDVEGVVVWEPLEYTITCDDFLEMIGWKDDF